MRAPLITLAVTLFLPRAALGEGDRLTLGAETTVGSMLSRYQREALGLRFTFQGRFSAGLVVADPLSVALSLGGAYSPSNRGIAAEHLLCLGPRIDQQIGSVRLVIDGNFGLGAADRTRLLMDVAVSVQWSLNADLGLGPVVRYLHVFAAGSDYPSDARVLTGGLALHWQSFGSRRHVSASSRGRRPERSARMTRPDRRGGGRRRPSHRDSDGAPHHGDPCQQGDRGLPYAVDQPGCGTTDRDQDNVADDADACVEEPGAPSPVPARNGCPGLVRIRGRRIELASSIGFQARRDRFTNERQPILRALAEVLRAAPLLVHLSIECDSNEMPTGALDRRLSEQRAAKILLWLVAHGIDASRLQARGFGRSRPRGERGGCTGLRILTHAGE